MNQFLTIIRLAFALLLTLPAFSHAQELPPLAERTAILFNSSDKDSAALASFYARARSIPEAHLIGLPLPNQEEISRSDFNELLVRPLVQHYDEKQWWQRAKDPNGNLQPVSNRIQILVCIRGVPSRIRKEPSSSPPTPNEPPFARSNEAAVDSELTLLGFEGLPIDGFLNNPFYKSTHRAATQPSPITLVGRIDAHDTATCRRMIEDAIATEKTGLWGMASVDLSQKYPQGDEWLESIIRDHLRLGIPTVVDRFPDTFPTNYPLIDPAIYYGWYNGDVNGPFLLPDFKFRRGAVAVHLHSFSACQLRDPNKNWCAPLLARGAAATIGNVYEPYLQMTHDLGILQNRLLQGWTLIEAAYAAIPTLSWQGLTLGDPLYRPFLHLASGSGEVTAADRPYRIVALAVKRWPNQESKIAGNLAQVANEWKSGLLREALGLRQVANHQDSAALESFHLANQLYTSDRDRIRLALHSVAIDRNAKRKEGAIITLRSLTFRYPQLPETEAAKSWLNTLTPPPPQPPAPK